jgi:hypothetical protein
VYRDQGSLGRVYPKTGCPRLTRCYSYLDGGNFTEIDGGEVRKFDMYEVMNDFFSFVFILISNRKLRSMPLAVI